MPTNDDLMRRLEEQERALKAAEAKLRELERKREQERRRGQ